MRIGLVTAAYGDFWQEHQLMARRVAGALACSSEVDVLVAEGAVASEDADGALTVRRFPTLRVDPERAKLLLRAVGIGERDDFASCSCIREEARNSAESLPRLIQEELARSTGGHSPALYEYLKNSSYDVLVFVDFRAASTVFGLHAVSDRPRVILLPLAQDTWALDLEIYESAFHRAARILVATETERELISRRLSNVASSDVIRNIGFALRVSSLAAQTEPIGSQEKSYLVVGGDLIGFPALARLLRQAARLASDFENVRILLVGRGWEHLPRVGWLEIRRASSRQDIWRWMSRALAVFDPVPRRVLGREVLEAMMYGAPVIVSEHGGATREHAELGKGGILFQAYADLRSGIEMLRAESVRKTFGAHGKEYAERVYSSPEGFIQRVTDAVLG